MHGSMFVPIILGSDKTTVSVGTGHSEYYPLYISIGNLHNNVRRAHRGGVALIAFLAIAKSTFYLTSSADHLTSMASQLIGNIVTVHSFVPSGVSFFMTPLLVSSRR